MVQNQVRQQCHSGVIKNELGGGLIWSVDGSKTGPENTRCTR